MGGSMLKLGIMQPYFFPYIGYFSLINYCDRFIYFDTPQYIHHGWVNRNRILKQGNDATYITVPTKKAARDTPINKIIINNALAWKEKIYGQLSYYKRKAPYYYTAIEVVKSVLDNADENLSQLCIKSIEQTCEFLGINTPCDIFSDMDLDIEEVTAPDEWALNITKRLGYKTYVNPSGGISFFDVKKYHIANIEIEFLKHELTPYIQRIGHFEPGLSIVDIMMFCSVEEIKEMLGKYQIL